MECSTSFHSLLLIRKMELAIISADNYEDESHIPACISDRPQGLLQARTCRFWYNTDLGLTEYSQYVLKVNSRVRSVTDLH